MTDKIFISYRRDDTAGYAYTIHERLARRFGEDQIFIDVDSIDPGVDFVDSIEKAIPESKVMLALIGQRWNIERLHNPQDFVRLELLAALKYQVLIIPVLIEDRKMPSTAELPAELSPLVRRNAIEIRSNSDLNRLVESVARMLAQQRPKDVVAVLPFSSQLSPEKPQHVQEVIPTVAPTAERQASEMTGSSVIPAAVPIPQGQLKNWLGKAPLRFVLWFAALVKMFEAFYLLFLLDMSTGLVVYDFLILNMILAYLGVSCALAALIAIPDASLAFRWLRRGGTLHALSTVGVMLLAGLKGNLQLHPIYFTISSLLTSAYFFLAMYYSSLARKRSSATLGPV